MAAATAFATWLDARAATWLDARAGGCGDALVVPPARDSAARDFKRHLQVDRALSPATVNQALVAMDSLFRFVGLGAAIVRREELKPASPKALETRAAAGG